MHLCLYFQYKHAIDTRTARPRIALLWTSYKRGQCHLGDCEAAKFPLLPATNFPFWFRSGSGSGRWSRGQCTSLPSSLRWDTEPWAREKPLPPSTSAPHSSHRFQQLCSVLAAYRGERGALREGKGQGHRRRQHGAELQTVKPDRSTKVEHVLQQCWCFSHFRVFFLLCTFKKSILQWCHPSWTTRDCWVFWAKWGMMKFSKLVLLLRAALRLETYTRTSMALFTSSLWQQVPGTFHQHGYLPAMRGVLFATSDYWIISWRLRSGRHDAVIATSQRLL